MLLVGDSLPSGLGDTLRNSVQLPLNNLLGLVSLPLLEGLSNTSDNTQSSPDGSFDLIGD